MYVETDFLIALTRDDDWLADLVGATLQDDKSEIHTSLLSYGELLVLSYDPRAGIDYDVPRLVGDLLELVPIRPSAHEDATLAAATFLEEHDMTPFDAFHAGIAATTGVSIHSSDGIYDEVGLNRIPLEPQQEG